MNLSRFRIDHPDEFRGAVYDIDWDKVENLLMSDDDSLAEYIYEHFLFYCPEKKENK